MQSALEFGFFYNIGKGSSVSWRLCLQINFLIYQLAGFTVGEFYKKKITFFSSEVGDMELTASPIFEFHGSSAFMPW